eukprot:TRINITY_DN19890_c0_g1_i10.p2 TRINITY_DN19890_c0_g1~~TRINITY_DN19890_c0_g1_i10.p2  ORF type:complete len:135 (+),score=21.67 TRINITY_DN19890_c0_g1_i10:114-518(+)
MASGAAVFAFLLASSVHDSSARRDGLEASSWGWLGLQASASGGEGLNATMESGLISGSASHAYLQLEAHVQRAHVMARDAGQALISQFDYELHDPKPDHVVKNKIVTAVIECLGLGIAGVDRCDGRVPTDQCHS